MGVVGDAVKTAEKQYQPAVVGALTVVEVNVLVSPEVVLGDLVATAVPGVQAVALVEGPQTSKTSVPAGAGEPVVPVTTATSRMAPVAPRTVLPDVVVALVVVVVVFAFVMSTHSSALTVVTLSVELPV